MIYGDTDQSYRKTCDLINRTRHQEGATPTSTLCNNTELEGANIINLIEKKTDKILEKNKFTEDGNPENKSVKYGEQQDTKLSNQEVKKAIKECAQ